MESSWWQRKWVGFDTETTGVDVREDRLVTAAIVEWNPAAGDTFAEMEVHNWLADPGREIPQGAQQVHGISTEYARAHGRPLDEVVAEVAAKLEAEVRMGAVLVIYNAPFDFPLLEAHLQRMGLPTLRERLGFVPLLDPLVLDRALDRYRRGSRKLADVAAHYGVSLDGKFHDAASDVRFTLGVLSALAEKYPQIAELTPEQIFEFQQQKYAEWADNYNAWARSRGRGERSPLWLAES